MPEVTADTNDPNSLLNSLYVECMTKAAEINPVYPERLNNHMDKLYAEFPEPEVLAIQLQILNGKLDLLNKLCKEYRDKLTELTGSEGILHERLRVIILEAVTCRDFKRQT